MKKLIIFCDGGLGNRMNVLIGGLLLAKRIEREVVINWPVNQWCGAPFESLFSIDKYEVNSKNINDLFDLYKNDAVFVIHVNQTQLTLKYVMDVRTTHINDINKLSQDTIIYYHNRIPEYFTEEERLNMLQSITIQYNIMNSVDEFCKINNIDMKILGLHLRRTDMELPPTTNEVVNMVTTNTEQKYFICSDDPQTENTFRVLDNVILHNKSYYVKKFTEGRWNQSIIDTDGRKTT